MNYTLVAGLPLGVILKAATLRLKFFRYKRTTHEDECDKIAGSNFTQHLGSRQRVKIA
jgi:hypothetical protein